MTSECSTALSTTEWQLPRHSTWSDKLLRQSVPLDPTMEEEEQVATETMDQTQRIQEAEKILVEIAKEYAAKRAAGLVPTKPVPARTLLWEEMEQRAQRARARIGRRGTCVFGRDSEQGVCGCARYKKAHKLPDGREVCACCHHGAPWHRLAGGTMSGRSHGTLTVPPSGGTCRSLSQSRQSQASLYSLGSDYYDEYDHEYESDMESDDDDAIANEVAIPTHLMHDPTPPLLHTHSRSEGDRHSLSDKLGLPPRLSSTSRHLDKLLSAIAKYRAMGLSEDEMEEKIRQEFPPTEQEATRGTTPRRVRAISR